MAVVKKRFVFLIVFISIILSFNLGTSAKSAFSISGRVRDYNSQPISGAEVYIIMNYGRSENNVSENRPSIIYATTDEEGNYEFEEVPTALKYSIKVVKNGYCSAAKILLELEPNVDFKLYESSYIKAKKPFIFTSAGLGGGYYTLTAVLEMAGIKYDLADEPSVELLESGVGFSAYDPIKDRYVQFETRSGEEVSTKYGTLVLVMSSPLKGIGGIQYIDFELERIKENIEWAKKNGVTIIGVHIEGESMRNTSAISIEEVIDLVAPECDMLIIISDGNTDDKFTKIAIENDIPIWAVENMRALVPVVIEVFGD